MSQEFLRKIRLVEPKGGYRLLISWFQGPQTNVDLAEMVGKGGVFDRLQNEEEFARVRIGDRNRVIEWPEPKDADGRPMIEIDADALYALAGQQKAASSMQRLVNAARSVERIAKGA